LLFVTWFLLVPLSQQPSNIITTITAITIINIVVVVIIIIIIILLLLVHADTWSRAPAKRQRQSFPANLTRDRNNKP